MLIFLQILAGLLYFTISFLFGAYGKIKIMKSQDEINADDFFRERKQFFWLILVFLVGTIGMAYSLWAFFAFICGFAGLGFGERLYPYVKKEIQDKKEREYQAKLEQAKYYLKKGED